mmetsp:Transcript_19785/g.64320  ORF Transcript_19785/g.64320 Transcript_19785/m.64320 type:complete len:743 (+) Transcript_19785:18-2246(+)
MSLAGDGGSKFRAAGLRARKVAQAKTALNAMTDLEAKGVDTDKLMANLVINDGDAARRQPSRMALVIAVVTLVNTCDLMGELLTMPVMPYLYQSFPGASDKQLDGGLGIFAEEAGDLGVGLAMQVGPAVYVMGGFFALLSSGRLHKMLGKKGTFLVWTFGGAIGFGLCALAGDNDWGLGVFWFLRFVTGLFSGAEATLTSYFADFYSDPDERANVIGIVSGLGMPIGLILGPVVSGYIIDLKGSKTTLFAPFWLGAVLEAFAGFLVIFYVPEPPAQRHKAVEEKVVKEANEKADADGGAEAKDGEGTALKDFHWRTLIYISWFAVIFGEFGEGAMNHINSIGFVKYEWVASNFRWVFMMFSLVVFIGIPLSLNLSQRVGHAWTIILCRIVAAIVLGAVALEGNLETYLILIYLHYTFKIGAMIPFNAMVIELAPEAEREQWIGYDKAFSTLCNGISPFLFVPLILDNEKWGPYPKGCDDADGGFCIYSSCGLYGDALCGQFQEGSFLIATAVTTGLSIIPMFLMLKRFPWRSSANQVKEVSAEEAEAWKVYKETGDFTWLSGDQLYHENMRLVKEGHPVLTSEFGNFEQDKPNLERIRIAAKSDFVFFSKQLQVIINQLEHGTQEEKQEMRNFINGARNTEGWGVEEKKAFAEWIVDWMEYAGYSSPGECPRIYKGIMMTAFPFMIERGEANEAYMDNVVDIMVANDNVSRNLLHLDQRNESLFKAAFSFRSFFQRLRPKGL